MQCYPFDFHSHTIAGASRSINKLVTSPVPGHTIYLTAILVLDSRIYAVLWTTTIYSLENNLSLYVRESANICKYKKQAQEELLLVTLAPD